MKVPFATLGFTQLTEGQSVNLSEIELGEHILALYEIRRASNGEKTSCCDEMRTVGL
ncbi:MAG: hypothetical protein KAI99_17340 [Cyclobacteriaceae bacterium]|nr:hypothetical protein [Cyclobacteriaceae bacterium]